MKNLLLFLAFAFSSPLLSQENTGSTPVADSCQKFSLSILGGLNINHMPYRPNLGRFEGGGSYNSNLLPEITYFAGASVRQLISKRFALKLDGQFALKGYGLKKATPLERHQIFCLDFVPQLEYNFFKNLFFSLGGYAGIRIKERSKFQDQNWKDIDDDFVTFAEKTDWGLASGLRVEFDRVSVLVKYQHGLTPGIKWDLTDDTGVGRSVSQFHRTLQVGLGFKVL